MASPARAPPMRNLIGGLYATPDAGVADSDVLPEVRRAVPIAAFRRMIMTGITSGSLHIDIWKWLVCFLFSLLNTHGSRQHPRAPHEQGTCLALLLRCVPSPPMPDGPIGCKAPIHWPVYHSGPLANQRPLA